MALNVIGLVSGGKDSFFSLLHCLAQGHRVVALANLHPGGGTGTGDADADADADLDSFMYQTVGHEVVPLYAAATGLPLYRQAIEGGAVQQGRDYDAAGAAAGPGETDETESMTALLRRVRAAHPEADAVCAGALLSTYQRTRVESVAARLGLVALAYLWQYPGLAGGGGRNSYLADLAAAGFDARVVKVASGGLDASLLWTDVASAGGRARLRRALARLGLADQDEPGPDEAADSPSMLGEGGEYETLVVAGPRALFRRGTLAVAAADRRVVHGGGGTAWLHIGRAAVVPHGGGGGGDGGDSGGDDVEDGALPRVRQPDLLEPRFVAVLAAARAAHPTGGGGGGGLWTAGASSTAARPPPFVTWSFVPAAAAQPSIVDATQSIVDQVRRRLAAAGGPSSGAGSGSPTHRIARTLVVLRRMADFPAVNGVYGTLFGGAPKPPARVTLACGDELPAGVDVAVLVSVLPPSTSAAARAGLHVQSRSYWAPANIGPYSQAVWVPAAAAAAPGNNSNPRIVSVAGQIPLVPATMELPDGAVEAAAAGGPVSMPTPTAAASFAFQTTLALQHLWRIGVDVGVQWWTSAVAYVPRQAAAAAAAAALPDKAVAVAAAWHAAHVWQPPTRGEDSDGDDDGTGSGPDLWDRTFNARYAPHASGTGDAAPPLPDWGVVMPGKGPGPGPGPGPDRLPAVFLAEVETLPRSAAVEWHAQAGLSQVAAGRIELAAATTERSGRVDTYQTVLHMGRDQDDGDDSDGDDGPPLAWVQTVQAWAYPADGGPDDAAWAAAVWGGGGGGGGGGTPDVVYADRRAVRAPADVPVVPCVSLWDAQGRRLAAVVVRTAVYEG